MKKVNDVVVEGNIKLHRIAGQKRWKKIHGLSVSTELLKDWTIWMQIASKLKLKENK